MKQPTVYVIQEIEGTKEGKPKINILGAAEYGNFKFILPELSQITFSSDPFVKYAPGTYHYNPSSLTFKLREGLKNWTYGDFLLLTGDPEIIGIACSIVARVTNGKFKILKWNQQERKYYPILINLFEI
tara:strand:- start:860 stop:1246 length:387 start_codon:yes stop_codon:yes gene_type:complete